MYQQSKKIHSTAISPLLNFGPLVAEIGWRIWGTQQISTGFTAWLRYCSDAAQRRSTKLCTMFGRLRGWYTIYTFSGLLPPNGILPGAKFALRSTILAALLDGTRAVAVSQTLRRSADGATYIQQGGSHVGHRATF